MDSRKIILKSGWQYGAAIPLLQVVVKVSYCVWYWYSKPVVVVVIDIVCDWGGVVL